MTRAFSGPRSDQDQAPSNFQEPSSVGSSFDPRSWSCGFWQQAHLKHEYIQESMQVQEGDAVTLHGLEKRHVSSAVARRGGL